MPYVAGPDAAILEPRTVCASTHALYKDHGIRQPEFLVCYKYRINQDVINGVLV
jgi:hypothetical protein